MTSKNSKIKVGISVGDYNGIGVEVIIKALKNRAITDFFTPVIFCNPKLFSYQKNIYKIQQNYHIIEDATQCSDGKINIVNIEAENTVVEFGKATEESTKMAILSLEKASDALLEGNIDVLVTAPINKDEMLKYGFDAMGHTEYLEKKLGNKKALMFLVTEDLKVAVSTHHIPLSKVAEAITKEKLKTQITELHQTLKQDFCVQRPKIAVLGLNPHAGDGGVIGTEEIEIISPAIAEIYQQGILAFGPYPADSFFQAKIIKNYDAILAMYHDQGLVAFKTLAYEDGVNYTAGLDYIRTSPDHGTAYNIAGENKADERSFSEAIFTSIHIYKNRTEYKDLLKNSLKTKKTKESFSRDEDLLEENA